MVRLTVAASIALTLVATANAGQIQIGGATGLNAAYIGSGGGGFTEQSYQTVLFSSATGNSPVAATQTDSTNHVTFNLDSDGASGGNSTEFWQGNSGATPNRNEITVPVNVYGVTDVWTLLNLDPGNTSLKDAQVYFNWSNGTTLLVTLCSSTANCVGANTGDQIQLEDSVLCTTGCASGDYGPTANGTPAADLVMTGSVPGFATSNVTVDTGSVYSSAYANTGGIFGSAGNVVLSDQGFIFSGAALTNSENNTLVSIQVREQDVTPGFGLGLSAVTVDATPEPSTIVLFLTGLGAIGLSRLRRN
jgi:hypothetical protein